MMFVFFIVVFSLFTYFLITVEYICELYFLIRSFVYLSTVSTFIPSFVNLFIDLSIYIFIIHVYSIL